VNWLRVYGLVSREVKFSVRTKGLVGMLRIEEWVKSFFEDVAPFGCNNADFGAKRSSSDRHCHDQFNEPSSFGG
jgi:hypothetical protein